MHIGSCFDVPVELLSLYGIPQCMLLSRTEDLLLRAAKKKKIEDVGKNSPVTKEGYLIILPNNV